MIGLPIAVVLLCAVNCLQFVINQGVRRRLERLEAGQRDRAPDLKPEEIAAAVSAALSRLKNEATVAVSNPQRMACYLGKAGWSAADVGDVFQVSPAQAERWLHDGGQND